MKETLADTVHRLVVVRGRLGALGEVAGREEWRHRTLPGPPVTWSQRGTLATSSAGLAVTSRPSSFWPRWVGDRDCRAASPRQVLLGMVGGRCLCTWTALVGASALWPPDRTVLVLVEATRTAERGTLVMAGRVADGSHGVKGTTQMAAGRQSCDV